MKMKVQIDDAKSKATPDTERDLQAIKKALEYLRKLQDGKDEPKLNELHVPLRNTAGAAKTSYCPECARHASTTSATRVGLDDARHHDPSNSARRSRPL